MPARVCSHSREELFALGFDAKEIVKYQRIAGRYRHLGKAEPPPGPWVARYRKKLAEGWTWKSQRPEDVDPKIWVKYQGFASSHRVAKQPIPDVYTYMRDHMNNAGGSNYRNNISHTAGFRSPRKRYNKEQDGLRYPRSMSDIKAIALRAKQIVEEKLAKGCQ